ncbi:hypothetical protein A2Z67_00870 [Candidatus Woesebacteria bacterium RBG_13_36_22]|uniref:Glycosyl transferase family 1 domain-containing protein n=1 Tax=Candidatus Woesebacteria bacterium RBG_13_36_22 TaxID=1802478 RepID=A0A1F7X678_9BACT|nr:MAG: hypothetical protein A2Z67_00870 [Candidatus Woesebacteria bacterium RBG_13_36_22]
MKVALVYDRVNKWGGAERVLLALHELFPNAPLYTSVYDEKKAAWASVFPKVTPSFLQRIPGANSNHELLAPLMPIAFESLDFSGFDLVITVTSEAAKGIITKPGTLHVCYCLTPTRYLWSHYDDYFKGSIFKVMTKPIISYLRSWDKIAAQRPDVIVAISTEVQKRIKKYYDRESEIIYPPVDVERFKIEDSRFKNRNYFLIVGRLVPYKKVDLAIEAFNELGLPLVIVGEGSEEGKLRTMAKSYVKFLGFVNEEDLPGIYKDAKAFIYPQDEDFGITAVEAQASGVPVIAYRAGGALDTVINKKTGIFFDNQSKESLTKAVITFEEDFSERIKPEDCINNTNRFSKDRFKKEFLNMVEKYY